MILTACVLFNLTTYDYGKQGGVNSPLVTGYFSKYVFDFVSERISSMASSFSCSCSAFLCLFQISPQFQLV